MKKKKICIIPFIKEQIPLITNSSEHYEITAIIAPGKDIIGKDISVLVNREKIDIITSTNLEEAVKGCDIVLISDITTKKIRMIDGKIDNPLNDFVNRGLEVALQMKKDIMCFTELDDKMQRKCMDISFKNGTKFKYFKYQNIKNKNISVSNDINVPVIFIGEMLQNCDGYEIFLKLLQRFKKDKLKPIGISEDKYNSLYDQYSIKFWNDFDPGENVRNIKYYVEDIVKKTYPDVVIVKLPKPMTAYDDDATYDFGMTAYLVSQALHVDYFLYCSLYSFLSLDFMSRIDENFKSRFGYSISAFHCCNQIVDNSAELKYEAKTAFIPINQVTKDTKYIRDQTGQQIFNLLEEESFNQFYNSLKSELFDLPYGVIA